MSKVKIPLGYVCIDAIHYADMVRDTAYFEKSLAQRLSEVQELKEKNADLQRRLADVAAFFAEESYYKSCFDEWKEKRDAVSEDS